MNKVILTGNLTKHPELKHTDSGMAICRFSIAVNKGYGEKQKTTFVNIVTFNKTAENCEKFISRGSKVGIIGELEIRQFTGNDGQTKYMTEVLANEVEFLSSKNQLEEQPNNELVDIEDTDLPF
jgi:single-strand DNA-binding protein